MKKVKSAVGNELAEDIRRNGYSPHLFYTPFYLPLAAEHEKALLKDERDKHEKHSDHDIPSTHRHAEQEVKAAVNHKHAKLGLKSES
ncbi:hypothetical protein [Janthinobacterium sp. RA13]|uniref:hypothetical protein n=1 Tax=Janthinobacterium sp. RA13 TaxID=1502762 RepID=UPI00126A3EFD|nr:hypothetical protein [Janthinobacterium sp. RA13]